MIDIKLLRESPNTIEENLKKRKDKEKLLWLKDIKKKDEEWRELQQEVQVLRNKRNVISREIAELKKQGKNADAKLKEAASIPKKIEDIEKKQEKLRKEIDHYLMRLPNLLHESVPSGDSEADNTVIEEVGKKTRYDFEVKSHVDILEKLDLADFNRAGKVAGSRHYYLKNELVLLDLALQKYALDFMISRGYKAIIPPYIMSRKPYEGVVDFEDFENVMYKIEGEDSYLIATSEHPLIAMFMDEILEEKDLPIKLAGISPCFRKEAGSHGKDTKGIFRVHQFHKIEQIIICKPEESEKLHEELLKNSKDFFKSLGIPFRVVNICTADIGTIAAKKYDIEAWMPAQNTYREVVSCSNCTDYQARRSMIRYRTSEGNKLVHTLNSTCVATSRAMVAILENYQNKDGTISIPDVLIPYMNGIEKIER